MTNLQIYEAVRKVPEDAKKPITGGRLNGKTDINPMWRLKTLTEQFGPCGIGWRYEIVDKHLEKGYGDEVAAFVDINVFVSVDGKWSAAIPGTGGSMFVAKEKAGPYTSDECYKMALTDALSVACKALGVGADVYWAADATKYQQGAVEAPRAPQARSEAAPASTGKSDEKKLEKLPSSPDTFIVADDLIPIVKACTDKDGKQNPAESFRFKSIYQKYGYDDVRKIKISDWGKIKAEFLDCALPFEA